jgi:PAS domain S-box-containing protein
MGKGGLGLRWLLLVLPIPGFALAIGAAAVIDVRGIYEPSWLLPTVNTVFLFLPGCVVAYVSIRGYVIGGSLSLLFFGGAGMVYGTGSLIAGWMIAILGAVDAGIVLHNTVAAVGGILNMASGLLVARTSDAAPVGSRRTAVWGLYAGLGIFVIFLSIASLRGLTPVFALPQGGFTPVRNATLGIAVLGFAVSALLFARRREARRSDFLFWGTLGMALLSIGLGGLFLQRGVGTLVGWCSRSAQYVGSAFLLLAVARAWRAAQRKNVPLERAIAGLFRDAEANYRALVETATDAILTVDREGRALLWNEAAERLFGYRHDEAVGRPIAGPIGLQSAIDDWLARETVPRPKGGIVRLARQLQTELRRRDGTTFSAEISVSARDSDEGWLAAIICRDVTDRRRAAERLMRLNRHLRTISLCNQALVRAEDEGQLLQETCRIIVEEGEHRAAWVGFLEDAAERLRPAAVVGCEPERVDRHAMTPADPAWAACPVVLALRHGSPQVVQDIPRTPPRCSWHEEAVRLGIGSSISLPLKGDGRCFGVVTIYSTRPDAFDEEEATLLVELSDDMAFGIRSIRTRAAHEQALAEIESVAKFPSQNPNPILRVREDGTLLYANASSAPLLELWRTPVGGRMPMDWAERIQEALRDGARDIIDVSCGDRVYSIMLAPIAGESYVNLYGRDITERLHLEAQLRQQQKLEALGTLAGGVAHEINNPIAGIMNYAQLIADTVPPDSPAAGHAQEILQETTRVATIVRNLLQFARQEKQTHSPARLADIIEQTLSLFRAVLRRDQITLDVDVPADVPPLKCRSQQLQQVLMNLLTNARDALNARYPGHHADKTIAVTVRPFAHAGRRWLRLTVADRGTGIPPAIQTRIFDPFFTTKPRDQGTGLGLAISHGIVKDHHGRLHFETTPGQGTRFHLDLPVDNGWTLGEEAGGGEAGGSG